MIPAVSGFARGFMMEVQYTHRMLVGNDLFKYEMCSSNSTAVLN